METTIPLWSTIELWLWAGVSTRPTSNGIKTHSPMIHWYIERWVIILGRMGGILSPSLVISQVQVISKAYVRNIRNNFGRV
jgi:hypothetical protein